ncbi:MAG: SAP domain-containing protein [Clostridia bacterium]|nr:SAP domain-containing protein [Clostridia bacterium]
MGLFDFLKKNKPNKEFTHNVKVTFSSVQSRSDSYRQDEKIALFLYFVDGANAVVDDGYYNYNVRFHCGDLLSPSKLHRQLISEGYFIPEPMENKLGRLKVQELRDLAAKHGIECKGLKKAELVATLSDKVSHSEINLTNAEIRYVLSDKAREYLKQYTVLLYLAKHREFGISIREYEKVAQTKHGTYRDVIWKIFNDEMNHLLLGHNYGAVCHVFDCMATFLLEENHYRDALRFYILKLYFNVNFPSIQQLIVAESRTKQYNKKLMMNMLDVNDFDISVARKIVSFAEHYDDAITEKAISMNLLPYAYLPKATFLALIHDMLSNTTFDSAEYMEKARKSAERQIKSL